MVADKWLNLAANIGSKIVIGRNESAIEDDIELAHEVEFHGPKCNLQIAEINLHLQQCNLSHKRHTQTPLD